MEINQTFGSHDCDFYVCNHLDKAKEKALEFLPLTDEWVVIYRVEEFKDGYKAESVLTIHSVDKEFNEAFHYERPMHIAWHTRGSCLNEKEFCE